MRIALPTPGCEGCDIRVASEPAGDDSEIVDHKSRIVNGYGSCTLRRVLWVWCGVVRLLFLRLSLDGSTVTCERREDFYWKHSHELRV